MKYGTTKRMALTCLLAVLLAFALASTAMAASYSKVYGQTTDKVRVRENASTNATIIDNVVKGACVYVTSSKESGGSTFVQVKYRDSDGGVSTGWICQKSGSTTYVKILSGDAAKKSFGVSGGDVPSKRVGTFTASERKASQSNSDSNYIRQGSSGTVVRDIQTKLKALKYYSGEITGSAGEKTVAAIKAFQSRNGLTADGIAGPSTIAKIDAAYEKAGSPSVSTGSTSSSSGGAIKLGSTGTAVSELQKNLKALGFYSAEITGNVGAKTETAIKEFQKKHGLTADGIAGSKTLEAIAAALRGSSGSSSSGSTSGVIKLGSQGSIVSQLQRDLKSLGLYTAEITGNVGSKTEAAIKAFQRKYGLKEDGIAGAETLARLASIVGDSGYTSSGSGSSSGTTLKLDSSGSQVSALQQNLTTLGYYYADITGHYGSQTQAAVRKFQKAKGLPQDGVAGPQTLAAIASALTSGGHNVATGGSSGSSTGTAVASSLREGDWGAAVTELQKMLSSVFKSNGKPYYYGEITGHFGTITKQAVKKFQDDNGLTVDGIAGSKTLSLLRQMTGSSSSTADNSGSGSTVSESNSYGRISKNNVYLRSSYSTNSNAKLSLANGTLVRISRTIASGNYRWYYITVKSGGYTYNGYVREDMITIITEDEYTSGGGSGAGDSFSQEIIGRIRVIGNNVRLRYTPNGDIVGYANYNDTFYYVDYKDGWYQTRSGYWIHEDYVRIIADDATSSGGSGVDVNATYRLDSTGSGVKWIQQVLTALKYYDHEISGHYGNYTAEAVRGFQRDQGLTADGVCGPATIKKLQEVYNKEMSSQGNGNLNVSGTAYNVEWFANKETWYNNTVGLKRGATATLVDLRTGKTLQFKVQSTGNHADVEPLTSGDTQVLLDIYGVSSLAGEWHARPMMVKIGNYQLVCSIYPEPHGSDTVSGNNFDGQFCLHFKGSKTHNSSSELQRHKDAIAEAVTILEAKGVTVKTTP